MAHIKIKGRWYLEEDLTDADRVRLGIKKDFDEKEILKELEETPDEVKKSPVKKQKSDYKGKFRKGKNKNITSGKVIIGTPTLSENKKGD